MAAKEETLRDIFQAVTSQIKEDTRPKSSGASSSAVQHSGGAKPASLVARTSFSSASTSSARPRSSDSSAYWQRNREQSASSVVGKSPSKNRAEKLADSMAGKSNIPSHNSGSYINLNASNAMKRELLEQEMSRLQEAAAYVSTVEQSDELTKRQKNVEHQLNILDAAEGNKPKAYTTKNATDVAENIPNINALGAGDGWARATEQRGKVIQERYQSNMELEKADLSKWVDETGHINGQANGTLANMSFGPTIDEKFSSQFVRDQIQKIKEKGNFYPFGTVAHAGCESIAAYNTLHDLGKGISLSQIIYDTERNNYTLGDGWLGTKVWKVDDVLGLYGVESKPVLSEDIQVSADSGRVKEGQIYIASIWNNKDDPKNGFGGIHTFEIVYSPQTDINNPWTVYNRGYETTETRYAFLDDLLTYNKKTGKFLTLNRITDLEENRHE